MADGGLFLALKPGHFTVREKGDPEVLYYDFKKYVENFQEFLVVTKAGGNHSDNHVAPCEGCKISKSCLRLMGGEEMKMLFEHVGHIEEADTFSQALTKIEIGIKRQTNQSTARFKLFQQSPQAGATFGGWCYKLKEQADRIDWANYDAKTAARDAILYQTDDKKLQKKILTEDLSYDDSVKFGLAMEQNTKKVDNIRGASESREEVAFLSEGGRSILSEELVRALRDGGFGGARPKTFKSKKSCQTCPFPTHKEAGNCPGKSVECFACKKMGHMKFAPICSEAKSKAKTEKPKTKSKKVKTRNVKEESSEDTESSESVGRVKEEPTENVRSVENETKSKGEETAKVSIQTLSLQDKSEDTNVSLLIDSGVKRTLLSEKDWRKMKPMKGQKPIQLKTCYTKFCPFGTNYSLPMLGRVRAILTSASGATTRTVVYVVKGEKQSLLGLKDGKALGIITITPEGRSKEQEVRRLSDERKQKVSSQKVISAGMKQEEINLKIESLVEKYKSVFKGLGRAKVEPVHIEVDPSVKPVQQKRRTVAFKYQEKFRRHIQELQEVGTVEGPLLDSESASGWISNVVIRAKNWDSDKIRVTLDTRPMMEAVKASHFPIPTPEELRHNFLGSDRYSVLDMNHSFHQFEMDDISKKLFVFYGPDYKLYRYNTLVMGTPSASSECHERLKRILQEIEGVQQIKDDLVVHGIGEEHDRRLDAVLKKFKEYNLTLRKEKCQFGVPEVKWFGNIYSKQGMSADPEKVEMMKSWPRPTSRAEVKSFLQTTQFSSVFMRPGQGRTYSDVTAPLRKLTNQNEKFTWSKECESSFQELKDLLTSDKVMACYDPRRKTRVYCDEGPQGVAATVAQEYQVEGLDHTSWRPVHYSSRAKTEAECNYGKVDGESLGVLSGVLNNRKYLYGSKFTVVVDHQPLVSLYKSHSRDLPVRVAKHKSKLRGFNFDVVYEPGVTTPSDYGSRHPPPRRSYSSDERASLGVEEEEEDSEVIVSRVEEVSEAVTLPVLQHYTKEDNDLVKLMDNLKKGRKTELKDYEQCWTELSLSQGVVMRGERIIIPTKLRPDVIAAAHEGCPGRESMLRQMRMSVWWPGISRDVKDYTESCLGCTAATPRNRPPPMMERETPGGPWQHCSADFKGPIGGTGGYYFHVLIDNYSRWPEVEVVKSTSFQELRPALDRSIGLLGVPVSVTHDRGPPYNSAEWKKYAKEKGFETRACTPEHPEGNGLAERFMSVLVKTVHAAVALDKDPKVEVARRVMNYRNTPHPSTGKTPAQLMMGRKLRTKVPSLVLPAEGKVHREAQETDKKTRSKRKLDRDTKKRAVEKTILAGDKVLVHQKKSTIKPPYDPKPYTVTEVKGTQVIAHRGSKTRIRNMAKLKVLKKRPEHLMRTKNKYCSESDSESDYEYIEIKPRLVQQQGDLDVVQLVQEEQEQELGQQEPEEQEERRYPTRDRKKKSIFDSNNDIKQKSPQQRKRLQGAAAKGLRRRQETSVPRPVEQEQEESSESLDGIWEMEVVDSEGKAM